MRYRMLNGESLPVAEAKAPAGAPTPPVEPMSQTEMSQTEIKKEVVRVVQELARLVQKLEDPPSVWRSIKYLFYARA